MRKTELVFGLSAGGIGIILGLLFLLDILPHSSIITYSHRVIYASICIAANVVGVAGALVVRKRHILGSAIMAAAMVTVMIFGFPWQSIAGVSYTISVVLAVTPENIHKKTAEE